MYLKTIECVKQSERFQFSVCNFLILTEGNQKYIFLLRLADSVETLQTVVKCRGRVSLPGLWLPGRWEGWQHRR